MSTTHVVVKKAMVSSTARDLPEHRKQVMDACQRQTFFPLMMEHLPASDAEAISASLAMVDQADVYIGVFAYRYGYIPEGHSISVTEMEYNRAIERKIPRLIFIMDKKHPVTIDEVEMGEAAEKLKVFKEKIGKENIVNFFSSPEELRTFVLNSLSKLPKDEGVEFRYHYVSDIPAPPEPYIAHPYVLSQAKGLVGRQAELNLLTDWFTGKKGLESVRIFNVVAIGGMGKSALTWKWFNDIAPQEQPNLAGRIWWSFYESDAYFENFVIRALAYVGRMNIEESQKIPPGQREEKLLNILDREPHLLVLDGLERILIAYARMDAAHLADDDAYDKATANYLARAHGLSESEKETFIDKHRLRKTADPRVGNFLRKLTHVRASWILVSTRLYPFDLQTITGDPIPRCSAKFLTGLDDSDAIDLWRNFGVNGTRDSLLPLFRSFGGHPLLLQALAGEVARFRPSPGDFDAWRKAKPNFNPFQLDLKKAKTHVLQFALQGLKKEEWKALHTVAAFRMPTQYETLNNLLCGKNKICIDEASLDYLLSELEDRGLLGWDRRANRYDLHPIVRGVVWNEVNSEERENTFSTLQIHFEAAPKIECGWQDIDSLEDLTSAIELCNTSINLGRFDKAYEVYRDYLSTNLLVVGASHISIELLEGLFSDRLNAGIYLREKAQMAMLFTMLGFSYNITGELNKGIAFFKKANEVDEEDESANLGTLVMISIFLLFSGLLKEAEDSARLALQKSKDLQDHEAESMGLFSLSFVLAIQGSKLEFTNIIEEIYDRMDGLEPFYWATDILFEICAFKPIYKMEDKEKIAPIFLKNLSQIALTKAETNLSFIDYLRLEGEIEFANNRTDEAKNILYQALAISRNASKIHNELCILTTLSEIEWSEGNLNAARELLSDVWETAERGPFPLAHSNARNVLCQIERDAGNIPAAIEAATYAYRLAWCDGPPYAYHYGLENAKKHLRELGAPEPEMPKTEST